MKQLSLVYLSLGSNLGDRCKHLQDAKHQLHKHAGEVLSTSSVYENPPLGFEAETDFLNLCLKMSTTLSPIALLEVIKSIETDLGRLQNKSGVYASRCIDIDIVLYDALCFESELLTLPHLQFRTRKFVLAPLHELSPQLIDPITHLTMEQLLKNCADKSCINTYNCE